MSELSKLESRRESLMDRKCTIEELQLYAGNVNDDNEVELDEINAELVEINARIYDIEAKYQNSEYERSV